MKKKILALLISVCCLFSVMAGCNKEEKENIPSLPDYSQAVRPMEFFAYAQIPEDKRDVETFKTYKEAGMTLYLIGGSASYSDAEDWDTSACKKSFEAAYEAGIEKLVVNDSRIALLIERKNGSKSTLVGESGCLFETQEELNAYVKECLQAYYQMPGFYGINLRDEPTWEYTENFGYIYKAIRAAGKELGIDNIYIHMNLLPLGLGSGKYAQEGTYTNLTEAYTKYVSGFLEATGADRASVDIYAFRGSGFFSGFYTTLQIFERECRKVGAEFTYCLQSFDMYDGTEYIHRKVEKSDMTLEINSLMGMGVNEYAYYTYYPANYSVGTSDACFLTAEGEKTNIYTYGQELMAYAQEMQKVLSHYKFQGMRLYTSTLANFNNAPYLTSYSDTATKTAVSFDNSYDFTLLKGLSINNDVAFVTELKDETNNLYMYMLQNVIDPANGKNGNTAMTVTADFGDEYTYVAEFEDGKLTYVKLDGGKYGKTLSAGYAVYIVPLK